MYAKPASNALLLVYYRDSILIVCNSIDGTTEFTGTLQVCNRMVWTGFRAFPTFFTFGRVNVGTVIPNGNRLKITCVDTCFPDTVLAVVRYDITGNWAVFTGRADYLNNIAVIYRTWRLAFRQADSLTDNFPFFINTASKLRERARNQLIRDMIPFLCQSPF